MEQLIMILMSIFPDTVGEAIVALLAIFGGASVLVTTLEKVADLTPTDKDNQFLGKARRFLAKIIAYLDRLALNPPKSKARDD